MDATTDPARAARDVDGIARIAADHDDLVAAEQRGHRPSLDDLAGVEVGHRVECESAGDASDGVEIKLLDEAVAPKELLDVLCGELRGRAARHRRGRRVWVRDAGAEVRLALRVELDREVLKTHGRPLAVSGARIPRPLGRDAGRPPPAHRAARRAPR